jgi:hypothetical protein
VHNLTSSCNRLVSAFYCHVSGINDMNQTYQHHGDANLSVQTPVTNYPY